MNEIKSIAAYPHPSVIQSRNTFAYWNRILEEEKRQQDESSSENSDDSETES